MGRFRRGTTAATVVGLSVVMVTAAGPARADVGRPGTPLRGRPCADVAGLRVADAVRRAQECSFPAGAPITSAVAARLAGGGQDQGQRQGQNRGRPSAAAARALCGPPYVNGDPRLGPLFLPRTGYFGTLLFGYNRYGNLTPSQFIAAYWNPAKNPPDWNYPLDDGFARNSNNDLLKFMVTLYPGQYLDRFGDEKGSFLAPGGSSFISRALPPNSLNTRPDDPAHRCNYHLYRVVTAFNVDGGPAAPAFEQPGGGLQYKLNAGYLTNPQFPLIPWLVSAGYLERIY